jgi:hypothetical protein
MERYAGRRQSEDDLDFEKGRIRALRDERLYIQKKTFTKWVNSFLSKNKVEVILLHPAPVLPDFSRFILPKMYQMTTDYTTGL